jgi:hypothetical protein
MNSGERGGGGEWTYVKAMCFISGPLRTVNSTEVPSGPLQFNQNVQADQWINEKVENLEEKKS